MSETEEQPGFAERDDSPTTDQSGAGVIDETPAPGQETNEEEREAQAEAE
jgi:hypothetical protein